MCVDIVVDMSATVLTCILPYLILGEPHEVGIIIIPTLQMRKLRYREVPRLGSSRTGILMLAP